MSIIKKILGLLFIFFGCGCLVNGFVNAPYCEGGVAVGFIIGALIFAGVFFHVGVTWMKDEKVWG